MESYCDAACRSCFTGGLDCWLGLSDSKVSFREAFIVQAGLARKSAFDWHGGASNNGIPGADLMRRRTSTVSKSKVKHGKMMKHALQYVTSLYIIDIHGSCNI